MNYLRFILLAVWAFMGYLLMQAGGIQSYFQGTRASSMGGAVSALKGNAYSTFYNPGSLVYIPNSQFQLGNTLSVPSVTCYVHHPSTQIARTDNDLTSLSYVYAAWLRSHDARFALGFSLVNPFAFHTRWDKDWVGRYSNTRTLLTIYYAQPTFSYKINDRVGLGLGVVYGFGSFLSENAIPLAPLDTLDGTRRLSARGNGLALNMGVYVQPSDRISIGINYHSNMNMVFSKGVALYDVPLTLASSYPENTFTTKIKLPSMLNLGAAYKITEKVTLSGDLNFTRWKTLDSLSVRMQINTPSVGSFSVPRLFKNTYALRIGTEYKTSSKVIVRAGAQIEGSPIQNPYISPEYPDATRVGLNGGISIKATAGLSLDLGLSHEFSGERIGLWEPANLLGTYRVRRTSLSIGLNYDFL